jgi:hypothetical protein
VNDLATTHPDLALEADGWDPSTIVGGSNERRAWRCSSGHTWEAIVFSRSRDGRGCPFCSGRRVTQGVNDLASLYPAVARELADVDPSTVHAGSKIRMTWRCSNGHVWPAQVSTRTRKIPSGCPGCAPRGGFDVTKTGYLYLLEHELWGLFQIGITNRPDGRIGLHQSRGWVTLDVVGPMDGVLARTWERDILVMLHQAGAEVASEEAAGKFDGYTEAWARHTYRASGLQQLMDDVTADDE